MLKFEGPQSFSRPDGTCGEALWFASCESCFLKHGMTVADLPRGDLQWDGEEPMIEIAIPERGEHEELTMPVDDEHVHICGVCFQAFWSHRDPGYWPPRCCHGCPCGTTKPASNDSDERKKIES